MFKGVAAAIRRGALKLAIRFRLRREVSGMLSTRNCWDGVRCVLVCGVAEGLDRGQMEPVAARLRERFPKAELTLVGRPGEAGERHPAGFDRVMLLAGERFTRLGLPRREVVSDLQLLGADLAVDLSPEYNPLAAYLCLLSGARLRVGFASSEGEPVFNYQVVPRSDRRGIERYRALARYIG